MRLLIVLAAFALGCSSALLWRVPAPASAGGPADFRDAVARAERSIVHVAVTLPDGAARSRDDGVGAGFVLSADGLVATSRHVVQGARVIAVDVPGHGVVAGQVLGHDDSVDLTLLRVPLTGLVPLEAGRSADLAPGQWVLAVGSPFRLARSWSVGIVSGLHRAQVAVDPRSVEDFIQTDATANLGNSGGPLLDASGRVVGVVTQILSRSGGSQGVTLATPIERVLAAVQRLTSGAGPRASLGATVRAVAAPGVGVEVLRLAPGSAAEAAGLRPGDRVEALDGAPVPDPDALQRLIGARRPGERVRLRVLRGGQAIELDVSLR